MKFKRLTAELVTEDIPSTIEYYTKTLGLELTDIPFKQFAIKDINGYILLFGQLG
jgi:catechol 2,3-dioxygenase-like lactoylglutathione lyase family enzyme